MTSTNKPIIFSISVFLLSMTLLPWWLVSTLLCGMLLSITWQLKTNINWQIITQFTKEFLAFGLTLSVCVIWVWQLSAWLTNLNL